MSTDGPLKVLTVCTGNVCRSPMSERLLQAGFDALAPGQFLVTSAGTGALVGSSMDETVQGLVREHGASPEGFTARQLTEKILAGQDLVLALSKQHRSAVVGLAPGLLRRTFTLRELARIMPSLEPVNDGEALPLERWRTAISRAVRARSAAAEGEDDVVDPFRRDESVYRQMAQQLVPAVNALLDWERQFA